MSPDDNDNADEAAVAIEESFEGPKGGRKASVFVYIVRPKQPEFLMKNI